MKSNLKKLLSKFGIIFLTSFIISFLNIQIFDKKYTFTIVEGSIYILLIYILTVTITCLIMKISFNDILTYISILMISFIPLTLNKEYIFSFFSQTTSNEGIFYSIISAICSFITYPLYLIFDVAYNNLELRNFYILTYGAIAILILIAITKYIYYIYKNKK